MSSTLVPSTSRGVNMVPTFLPDIILLNNKLMLRILLIILIKCIYNYEAYYVL